MYSILVLQLLLFIVLLYIVLVYAIVTINSTAIVTLYSIACVM